MDRDHSLSSPTISDQADDEYVDFSAKTASVADGLPKPPGMDGFLGEPDELPEATEDTCICLAGPCRHFWRVVLTTAGEGNVRGTYDHLKVARPQRVAISCTAGLDEMDLSFDNPPSACNRWDPFREQELTTIRINREDFAANRASRAQPLDLNDLFPKRSNGE